MYHHHYGDSLEKPKADYYTPDTDDNPLYKQNKTETKFRGDEVIKVANDIAMKKQNKDD